MGQPAASQAVAINSVTGKLKVSFYANEFEPANTTLLLNQWYHVALTFDGTTATLYLNGSVEGTKTTTLNVTLNGQMNMGRAAGLSQSYYFDGKIDEVAIWDSAFTLGQIQTIYNDGLPADLTDLSPISWWRMGDESGWPLLTNKMAYSKYSLEFDGVDDYVDCGQIDAFKGVTGFTISGWFKQTTLGVKGFMFGAYISNSNFISAETWNDNNMYFEIREGASSYAQFNTYASVVTAGEWFHMAMVFDGTEPIDNNRLKAYINGSPLSMSHSAAAIPTITLATQGDLILGNHTGYNNYWEGGIDEFAIFDTPFSPSQITTLYNGGTPNDISSLNPTNYYKVDGSVYPNIDNAMAYSKKSVLFDGVNSDVNMGDVLDQTGQPGSDFSISAWVKVGDIAGAFNMIFTKGKAGGVQTGYEFYVRQTTGYLTFFIYGQNNGEITRKDTGTHAVVEGQWTHLVVTYTWSNDGSGIIFYTNGELTASSLSGGALFLADDDATNGYDCLIGARETGAGYPMDGSIDDVSFFESVLSLSDVQTIYNNGKPADISALSPLGWWKMGDGDFFPTITDHGSGGNDGTMEDLTGADIKIDSPMGYGVAENMIAGINNFSGGTPNGNGGAMINMSQGEIQHDVPKYSNKSFLFDGVEDYVTMGDVLDEDGSSAFSLSAWVKLSSSGNQQIVGKMLEGDTYAGYGIYITSDKIRFSIINTWSSNALSLDVTSTFVYDVWTHICITYDGSQDVSGVIMYVDGSPEATVTQYNSLGASSTTTASFSIGSRNADGAEFTEGNIDEVSIFNSELTLSQVQSIYNGGVPVDISDLSPIGWWRMGEGATFSTDWTIPDVSTNSNNGTSDNMGESDRKSDTP